MKRYKIIDYHYSKDEMAIKWNDKDGPFQDNLNLARQIIHWDYNNGDIDLSIDIRNS